ncbi:MAG: CvpA family protein [Pirellulaceae bacterium]|nr:CvpA family protein [Pirellulaceae bacterium]
MSFLLPVLLLIIFIAVVASLYTEGMWGNSIMLVNVMTAGVLATGYFEPLANRLESMSSFLATYTYLLDFLSLWLIFAVSLIVLRICTDKICRVRVRFLKLADQVGGLIFACMVALTMVCFTTFTLHTAPLAKEFMFGGFKSNEGKILGWSPDRWWLRFAWSASKNAYCWPTPRAFDHHGDFIVKYETRRQEIEEHVGKTQAIRKNTGVS